MLVVFVFSCWASFSGTGAGAFGIWAVSLSVVFGSGRGVVAGRSARARTHSK